ncbi:MAG: FHA domain-containing protein [Aggregatilineales bacterium]
MQADYILDYDTVAMGEQRKLYLLTHVTAPHATGETQRRPLNLSLVIDRSGSMAGDKLDYTRQSAQFLVQNLTARDILSIVLYNDTVETLLQPELVKRKDIITQRIASIKASGTTNLSGGWLAGCNLVAENLSPDYVNRTILMSDGLANRGVTSSTQIIGMTRQKYEEQGISTTTMGLGKDFNEDLLMAMANAGGGAFYFIESPEVAPLIFSEELQGLLNVVGQNLTISLENLGHITHINQLNAYAMTSDGNTSSFRLGDVFGDEVKALLLEITLPAFDEVGHYHIATLSFEYDELLPSGGVNHHRWEKPVMLNVVSGMMKQLANPQVQQPMLLLKAAQARKWAVNSADKGEYNTAAKILRGVAEAIDQSGLQDDSLREEHTALLEQASEIELGASRYNEYSRKMMATQAFYTMTSRHEDTVMLRVREHKRNPQDTSEEPAVLDVKRSEIKVERVIGYPPTQVTWNEKIFELKGDLIRIGRSHHNEIVIAAKGVSRFHCQIKRDGTKLLIEDLGSTNGTIIAGNPIKGERELNIGDVIYLCDEKLIFHDGE